MATLHQLKATEVRIRWRFEPCGIPVAGNVMASGDKAADEEAEQEVLSRLARDDQWAWFDAHCTVEWGAFQASDVLGCCSFYDREDFMACHGTEMVNEALHELNRLVAEEFARLEEENRKLKLRGWIEDWARDNGGQGGWLIANWLREYFDVEAPDDDSTEEFPDYAGEDADLGEQHAH